MSTKGFHTTTRNNVNINGILEMSNEDYNLNDNLLNHRVSDPTLLSYPSVSYIKIL